MLAIHLCDINPDLVEAWKSSFQDMPEVSTSCGDIFLQRADAIVSPANSFGYMDGGIDLVYSHFFGWELEGSLKALIAHEHFGELPVGQAVVLPTGSRAIPFLVSAPTMRIPSSIGQTVNVYLAFRAALVAVLRHNEAAGVPIQSILVPGFGTGIGGVPPARAARQMRRAFDSIIGGEHAKGRSARAVLAEHHELLS